MKKILEIKNLNFRYSKEFCLDILHLEIQQGDFIFLMGLNGSGKTTLLYCISKILKPNKGDILLNGESILKLSPFACARQIALLEQTHEYPFPYTVLEIVLMGRFAYQKGNFFETSEDLDIARKALLMTNLEGFEEKLISQLSSGEKRRVEIARALCQGSEILLLDEPLAFLDQREQNSLMNLLEILNKEEGKTILFVTHQLGLLEKFGKRAILLENGIVEEDVLLEKRGAVLEKVRNLQF